jgi:hypothetical protein
MKERFGFRAALVLAAAAVACASAPSLEPGASFHTRDCGFNMRPDAGSCDLHFSGVFTGRDENGNLVAGIGDGWKTLACGEVIQVCGGRFTCTCSSRGK